MYSLVLNSDFEYYCLDRIPSYSNYGPGSGNGKPAPGEAATAPRRSLCCSPPPSSIYGLVNLIWNYITIYPSSPLQPSRHATAQPAEISWIRLYNMRTCLHLNIIAFWFTTNFPQLLIKIYIPLTEWEILSLSTFFLQTIICYRYIKTNPYSNKD